MFLFQTCDAHPALILQISSSKARGFCFFPGGRWSKPAIIQTESNKYMPALRPHHLLFVIPRMSIPERRVQQSSVKIEPIWYSSSHSCEDSKLRCHGADFQGSRGLSRLQRSVLAQHGGQNLDELRWLTIPRSGQHMSGLQVKAVEHDGDPLPLVK